MTMIPLVKSHEASALEGELKALAIKLYKDTMEATANDINVYGAPHLGSFSLVERNVSDDGLAVLRQGDETGMRYLFKAWRHRNPQRGTHFLKTYLQVLFGDTYFVNQMWQEKAAAYPESLKTADEIAFLAADESDYFLTSRINVDIDTDIIPERIVKSLRSTVAARFVLDLRVAKFQTTLLGIAQHMGAGQLCFGSGEIELPQDPLVINEFAIVLGDD